MAPNNEFRIFSDGCLASTSAICTQQTNNNSIPQLARNFSGPGLGSNCFLFPRYSDIK